MPAVFPLAALDQEFDPFQIVVGITIKTTREGILVKFHVGGRPIKVSDYGSFHSCIHNRNLLGNPGTLSSRCKGEPNYLPPLLMAREEAKKFLFNGYQGISARRGSALW